MTGAGIHQRQAAIMLEGAPGGVTKKRVAKLAQVIAAQGHDMVRLEVCADEHTGRRFGEAQKRRGRTRKIGYTTYAYQLWATWALPDRCA